MGRPKNKEYWNRVTKEENGGWKCKQCGRTFKGGASRIRAHFDVSVGSEKKRKGKGIAVCKGSINCDPKDAPMEEVAEGGHNIIDTNIGASNSTDHQTNIEATNLLRGSPSGNAVPRRDDSSTGTEISHINEMLHDLTCEESDIKGQLELLESRGKKRKNKVDVWLDRGQKLKNKAEKTKVDYEYWECTWLYEHEIEQLTEEVRKHKEQKPMVLTNELVGESFEGHVKKMWKLLVDDQVFIIGIHGMGGVGKTCLAAHMEKEIKRKGSFHHVFWVTVSQNFSILKLQHDIAERIGIKLNGDDERMRAENLSLALETKERSVLILDDVWKFIDLEKVGIPLRGNGIKLILTSRLEHVCQQMDCLPDNIIRMYPLSFDSESLVLFLIKLGHHGTPATLPPQVLEIAERITRECRGLPLGISVMARTMKGVNGIHQWRHALSKLQNLTMGGEMEEEVFKVLKLSYDNMRDKDMQNCFLHFALFGSRIGRNDMVRKLVEDGVINGRGSLKEIFDKGHTIVDELVGHSLLLKWLEMHNLVRYMACHIMEDRHMYMVKCNHVYANMSHMYEWKADSEAVYVMSDMVSNIQEIPAGTSPCCPQLSTLILSFNSHIPECFFENMSSLSILKLSHNDKLRSLPSSMSYLRSLTSLVIRDCKELKYVSPIGTLRALSTLVISGTSVEQVPDLKMLINLKWLDLSWNKKLRLIPGTVLSGLTNLQYLDLLHVGSINVGVEDVQGMAMLEWFAGSFCDRESYNNCVQKIQGRPKNHRLLMGEAEFFWEASDYIAPNGDLCSTVAFGDCEESTHLLPADFDEMYVLENTRWICLCGALSYTTTSSLRYIEISDCPTLQSLFCLSSECCLCSNLKNLESLRLLDLKSLTDLCKEDVADRTQVLSPNGVFSHLKHLNIYDCDGIEMLLTAGSWSQLQNLETISVKRCVSVREIFAVSSSDGDDGSSSNITLPRLTKLELTFLPQLKTVCRGIIVCNSRPVCSITHCPNLEESPTVQVCP